MTNHRNFTDHDFISALRLCSEETGKKVTKINYEKWRENHPLKDTLPPSKSFISRYKIWKNALKSAGFTTGGHKVVVASTSSDLLIQELRSTILKLGYIPTTTEYIAKNYRPIYSTLKRHLRKSWKEIIELTNLKMVNGVLVDLTNNVTFPTNGKTIYTKRDDDLTGKKFGKLTALRKLPVKKYKSDVWLCRCDCGNETKVVKTNLIRGTTRSCGCLRKIKPAADITGQRFGKMVAIERRYNEKAKKYLWLCQCDCGNTKLVPLNLLRKGDVTTCGCQNRKRISPAHDAMKERMIDGVIVPRLTSKISKNNTTGYKGVSRFVRYGKVMYRAQLTIKGKIYRAGPFEKLEDAVTARKELEEKYHKPFIEAFYEKPPTE